VFENPGAYTITATYGGDDFHSGSNASESHTVVKAETTTSLTGDEPDPSQAYQPIMVSFVVTSSLSVPTGVVTVTTGQDNAQCSQQLVAGMGSCELVFEVPGAYTITATYGGDDFHIGSNASESHLVVKAETTTSLTGDEPDPSLIGGPITVTFEVTSTYGLPTGMVTVTASISQQSCSDILVDGMGKCVIHLVGQGIYTITATYAGDTTLASSSDSSVHQVVDFLRIYLPIILRE
jgi:hypothetical protein